MTHFRSTSTHPIALATWVLLFCLSLLGPTAWGQNGLIVALRHSPDGLRLTHTNVMPTAVNALTPAAITSDMYPSGVADLDCFGERFFYVRGLPQRIVTADALTGELIHQTLVDNPLDADVSLSNIAYDWTDDRLIGTAHFTSALGDTQLQLVEVDPATGTVEVLSQTPAAGGAHGSGNCDLDAVGNRYFLLSTTRLFTWDATTGEMLSVELLPDLDPTASGQFLTHLTYHPLENALYALHVRNPDEFDPWGPFFQSEIRLARKMLPDSAWTFVSGEVISMDGIQSGQCDLDPFNNRIYYVQDGKIRAVDCATGELAFTLNPPADSDAISEWANLQYHDLSLPPATSIPVPTGGTLASIVEWDGTSPLTLQHNLGAALTGAWVSGPGNPTAEGAMQVDGMGLFVWEGERIGTNGETLSVTRSVEVVPASTTDLPTALEHTHHSSLTCHPNPIASNALSELALHWDGARNDNASGTLRVTELTSGRVVAQTPLSWGTSAIPSIRDLAPGLYLLTWTGEGVHLSARLMVR